MATENDDEAPHPHIDVENGGKFVSGGVSTVKNWEQRLKAWKLLCSDEDNPWFLRKKSIQSCLESTLGIKLGTTTVDSNIVDHPFIDKMLEFKAEYDELKIEMEQYPKECEDLKDDIAKISVLQDSALSSQDAALGQKRSRAEATGQPRDDSASEGENHFKELFLKSKQGLLHETRGLLHERQGMLHSKQGRLHETQGKLKYTVYSCISDIVHPHMQVQHKLDRFATWDNETKTISRSMSTSYGSRFPKQVPEESPVSVAKTKTILTELKANLPDPDLQISESSLEPLAKFLVSLIDLEVVESKPPGTTGNGATKMTETSSSKVEQDDDDDDDDDGKAQADHVKKIVEKIIDPKLASETTNKGGKRLKIRQPSPKGANESFQSTTIIQPIIHAIIYRLLGVVGVRNKYVSTKQEIRWKESDERGRDDVDFLVHEMHKSLFHALPSMIGGKVEIKKCGNNEGEDDKYIDIAGRRLLGKLSRRLQEEFNFLGSGVDCKLYGVAVSLSKVSVVSASLENVGTKTVSVSLRKTPGVPLLTKEGLELLTLALIGSVNQPEANHKYAILETLKGEDQSERAGVDQLSIGTCMGSGGFGIVYEVVSMNPKPSSTSEATQDAGGYFLKISHSIVTSVSLQEEAKFLRLLNANKVPNIPGCIQQSSFRVTLNGFVSKTHGLLLHGMIGQPASTVDWAVEQYKGYLPCVIQKVYETLKAAHEAGIYHLDIRPANIIVPKRLSKESFVDSDANVLVIDWGVGALRNTKFFFRGTCPYAHDDLLVDNSEQNEAKPEYDMASLLYTFYHLHEGALPWFVMMDYGKLACDITERRNA
ncbi:MAG: hypothetical protein SGBAC_007286, partial [Bacillariaceae sp.]